MSRQGSVKKDKNGRWSFVVDTTPPGAPRKQVFRRGFATKREALEAMGDLQADLRSGRYTEPSKQSLAEFLEEWLATIEPTVRPATHYSYKRNVNLHVVPYIGEVRLQAVDAGAVNGLYARLLAEGNRAKAGGLSARSVHYVHTILHRAMKDAVRWGRLQKNPTDAADPPRLSAATRPEIVTWPADTVRDFLVRSESESDRYYPLWVLLATTGMRRGEALGLRWADLELDAGQAAIRQTVIAVGHKVQMGTPKTARSRRTVALDAGTVAVLRGHRAKQAAERLQIGSGWRDHDLVFCKVDGEPLHPERASREFDRRVERWEFPKLTLHGLRHTWATLALKAGVHPKVVQERLGHSTIGTTLGIYSHVTEGMQEDAAAQVAGLFL